MRLLLSFACALLFVLLPRLALAQMVAITNKMSLIRRDTNGGEVQKRPQALNPEGINLQDCHDDLRIEFSLTLSGYQAGDVMEAWATDSGGDCTQQNIRNTPGSIACYRLQNVQIPLTPNPVFSIPVRDIIAGLPQNSPPKDSSGCRLVQGVTPITVHFLLFRGGDTQNSSAADNAVFNTKTVGPNPLTNVKVQPGNTRVTISWDQIGEGGGAQDVIGVKAYCDLSPQQSSNTAPVTTTTCTDASTIISDGSDDQDAGTIETIDGSCSSTTTPGTTAQPIPGASPSLSSDGVACSDNVFSGDASIATGEGGTTSGIVPDATFDKYLCGNVTGVTGNTIIADHVGSTPLPNDKVIAVAVAGIDSYSNVGILGAPVCQFPEVTQDFWQDYKGSSGGAGGCAIAAENAQPAGTLALLGLSLGLGVSMLRKRSKR